MFSAESTQYLELVARLLIDGSEEGDTLFHQFIKSFPTPLAVKNMTIDEKKELLEEGEQMEILLAALKLGELVVRSKTCLFGHAYSSQILSNEVMNRLSGESQESLYLVGTDIHNDIIDIKQMFIGGLSECNVYPDQIFRRALIQSASGIAVVHNHPSGSVEPSSADRAMIKRLERGCQMLGLTFLDFLIVAQDNYYSWRENQAFQKK
ncbi:JAB domain-containing protein [Limosilactobacillus fastidiosus]|uniref:JAB domain-containing protein n=1 Tax=Limosilactobacillus fastidiosus TaxID=2759855 RepID=A0A7W3YC41_9LACO|nr:JAB domain-containing protein [Limosilactobacillus fastidiosus]MBB1085681.1 JAB domain-containing protein [Limosilactobacillus fastidiosus]MCD7086160.1 JAB domain-containing protein [Limosilactobacillus fastidiosus]MCD7114021.1 JAB domain-containing protein [Limosilactobacillus fastidiosus]MCD7115853.1 JAB domain-containing protein [Limosilactobacillus fastidiosus]